LRCGRRRKAIINTLKTARKTEVFRTMLICVVTLAKSLGSWVLAKTHPELRIARARLVLAVDVCSLRDVCQDRAEEGDHWILKDGNPALLFRKLKF